MDAEVIRYAKRICDEARAALQSFFVQSDR